MLHGSHADGVLATTREAPARLLIANHCHCRWLGRWSLLCVVAIENDLQLEAARGAVWAHGIAIFPEGFMRDFRRSARAAAFGLLTSTAFTLVMILVLYAGFSKRATLTVVKAA
jgi:hypothetical protein